MPKFEVAHSYRAIRDGLVFGPWSCGDSVELSEDDAAWVMRDSQGVLRTGEPEPEVVEAAEREAEPAPNRKARPGRNRGA